MGDASNHRDLPGAILACRPGAVVVTGPVRSGKTDAALALYEHYLTDPTAPGCVLLAPNRLTVQQLRRRLLQRSSTGVLVAPAVMTFTSLAGLISEAAGAGYGRISPVHRRMALKGIIADRVAAGELEALGAVADTPGLVVAVDRAVAELKRAAVEPDALAAACGGGAGKHRDLLTIYRAYQEYLHESALYDEEGCLWQARDDLAAMDRSPLTGVAAVVADGFTDFTPTQLGILRLLSADLERLVITLPYDAQPQRKKLWRWTSRQLQRIERTFGGECQHVTAAAADDRGPTGGLLDTLFAPIAPAADWPEGLAAVETAGLDSECRAIARWAKGLLASGVAADQIAVIARRIDPYAKTLHRVFTEAGLPAPSAELSLADTPPGRMLLGAVRMADGFASADVLAVLGSSYFRAASLEAFSAETVDVAGAIIRRANVQGGRQAYAAAVERIAGRIARITADGDDEFVTPLDAYLARMGPDGIAAAGRMIEGLLASVDAIAASGSLAELAQTCAALLSMATAPIAAGDDASIAADLRARSALATALDELISLADVPGAGRRLTAAAFRAQLTTVFDQTPAPAARVTGAILLADALDARAGRMDHVWLAGLNEGAFPAPAGDQALMGEADRRRWAEAAGLPLDVREDLTAREMLLFYLTLARADRTLSISWHYSDDAGRPTAASGFVDALLRPTGRPAERILTLPPAEFAPPIERIISRRELLNSAMGAAADRSDPTDNSSRRAALHLARCQQLLGRLAGPLFAWRRRWAAELCGPWDGVLDDPALLADLRRRIPGEVVLSASRLNTYLSCPWRYFAERVLNLAELPEPTETMLPRHRGSLVHAVLRRMIAAMSERGDVFAADLATPAAMEALDAAIAAEAAAAEGRVACRGLWENELRQLRRDVATYLLRHGGLPLPGQRVNMLEAPFGMAGPGGGDAADPVVLNGPSGAVRLRGMIDRVDVIDTADGPKAFVIDYKTGRLPDLADDVQLPVYIHAAAALTGLPVAGGAFHAVSRDAKTDRYLAEVKIARKKVVDDDVYTDHLAALEDKLQEAVAGVAGGRFAVMAAHKCVQTYCPFRRICGYSDARRSIKAGAADERATDE